MDNLSLYFLISGLSHQSLLLDAFMIYSTEYVIFITGILMFILAKEGGVSERKAFILSLLAIPMSILLIKVIHLFYYEPRPFITHEVIPLLLEGNNASFPSRHTTIMSIFAFAATYFKHQWNVLIIILMALVGVSRIYVGVHYPIDIVGGILTGFVSILLTKQLIKFLKIRFSLS